MTVKIIARDPFDSEIERFSQKSYVKRLLNSSGMPLRLNNGFGKRVLILIDGSTSMGDKNKMNQAKEGAVGFAIEALNKGYSVGVISFASEAELLLEPQHEISCIKAAVEEIYSSGYTNMQDAIYLVIEQLSGLEGERIICIVTDGQPNDEKETLKAAEKAKSMGIEIMAIGTDDADQKFLAKIVTRKELSVKVEVEYFKQGITRMAKLLPDKTILALKQGMGNQNYLETGNRKRGEI
ncbi:VWA domain-containing protein [bacterium]|nr:VWA domain-containing protein [bacterium]